MARNGFSGSRRYSPLFSAADYICSGVPGYDRAKALAAYDAARQDEEEDEKTDAGREIRLERNAPVVRNESGGRRKLPARVAAAKRLLRGLEDARIAEDEVARLDWEKRYRSLFGGGIEAWADAAQESQSAYLD